MSSPVTTRRSSQKARMETRSMINATQIKNPALLAAKKKARNLKVQELSKGSNVLTDIYQNAITSMTGARGLTGIVYDESMPDHRCLWDENHPERPERFTKILTRCMELKLIERCFRIPARLATKDEILSIHTESQYKLLESTCELMQESELESVSAKYDSIFVHPTTFKLAKLSVGSTINLIDCIVKGDVHNGMAIIRPPGHHAMKAEFNGYCFFNNVAAGAKYALDKLNLKRIVIVDWDVHHGQGTQQFFYDDDRVLYFSIHRFEHGSFWPNLKQSDFDFVGIGKGKGFNFNVPLNSTGMKNGDYLAIFQQLLIPVLIEYQPELVIISAGYDAALGCPEGEMELTPAVYAHFIEALRPIAGSKLAVVLEGGYCLTSLAESASLTLRALLGDFCPSLAEPLMPPSDEIKETILNCIYSHRPYWKCLSINNTYDSSELHDNCAQPELHKVTNVFIGGEPLPEVFPTRNCYPVQTPETIQRFESRLQELKLSTILTSSLTRVCYVYDEAMMAHKNLMEDSHPESPDRISRILDRHNEFKLLTRMQKIPSRHATTDELCLSHTRAHVNFIRKLSSQTDLQMQAGKFNSVYFHSATFDCATIAAGSVLQVVNSVLKGESRSGVCIVRPPGHHAGKDNPHGFCIFNNVAIAAQYAIRDHGLKRILIIDWDVHHGNGTQQLFENNGQVLFISIHRYDNGNFFPKSTNGNYDAVGSGPGEGFNVNIPWNKKGMGDMEYILAFQQIVLPIAYEFNPELILVSAGFDAAAGDPLGGCKLSPEVYGYFTTWLSALANGKIILCLEGGYNVNSISYAMTMCTKALLGDPLPTLNVSSAKNAAFTSCVETITDVISVQQKYWKSLQFNKKLPNCEYEELDGLESKFKQLNLTPNLKFATVAEQGSGDHTSSGNDS